MPWSIFTQGGGDGVAVTWAKQFLKAAGLPVTTQNVQFVYDWEQSEGGGGKYNPLNQGPVPGNPSLTSTGPQYGGGAADFVSWQAGIQGAVDYIRMGAYSGVYDALKQGNDYSGAAQALWDSPWAGSHYGYGSAWNSSTPPGAQPIPATDLSTSGGGGSSSGSGGGAGGSGAGVQLIPNPFWDIWNTLFGNPTGGIIKSGPGSQGPLSSVTDAVAAIANVLNELLSLFTQLMLAIEWLFVPSHWVRIFCFIFGAGTAIPGLHALMHTGQSDISLALGILLVSISGIFFFIAFHNLPSSVSNLKSLLNWVGEGVRTGQAPSGEGESATLEGIIYPAAS